MTVLAMLLLRYPGVRTARQVAAKAPQPRGDALQIELVFESAKSGKRRVVSPTEGVAAMSKSDVVSWGGFGLVFGLIVGVAGNGGILTSIESGVVTGVLWAMFGLVAGALYGLLAGRAVSARRLKGNGPLLPADSSMLLAWADGDIAPQTITDLSSPGAQSLILRFNPAGRGALLEV